MGLGHEIYFKKRTDLDLKKGRSRFLDSWEYPPILCQDTEYPCDRCKKRTPIAYVYSPFLATITNYKWSINTQKLSGLLLVSY
jgi:hypothetical protein